MNPLRIFLFVWTFQIIGHLIYSDDFYEFSSEIWFIILLVIFSFAIGVFCNKLLFLSKVKFTYEASPKNFKSVNMIYFLIMMAYIIFGFFPIIGFYLESGSIYALRDFFNQSAETRDFSVLIASYISAFLVIFSVYIFSFSRKYSKIFLAFVFLVAFCAAIFSTGRTLLLLLFTSVFVSLYLQNRIGLYKLTIAFLFFVILFFSLALLNDKGGLRRRGYPNCFGMLKFICLMDWHALTCFLLKITRNSMGSF